VECEWNDGEIAMFHSVWLRDHCPLCINKDTKQREVDTASISTCNDESAALEVAVCGDRVHVDFASGHRSNFASKWLKENAYWFSHRQSQKDSARDTVFNPKKILWNNSTFCPTNTEVSFAKLERSDAALLKSLTALETHGIAYISQCPITMDGTERVANRIGRVRETLYGRMWDTAPKDVPNDTAYTNVGLGLHTDCTYMRDPPGLQMLHCVAQAEEGGENTFVDGFNALGTLRSDHPDAFDFFASTSLPFYCVDLPVHLKMVSPVIDFGYSCDDDDTQAASRREVTQLRFNNSDRGVLSHLSPNQIQNFYEYWPLLSSLIHDEEAILKFRMSPGDVVIFDNHRVLHGRESFVGFRNMLGCYFDRDEWESRLRVLRSALR